MRIIKVASNMKMPEISFHCLNTKDGRGRLRVDFSTKEGPAIPWLEITFNKAIPNTLTNAFNSFDMTKVLAITAAEAAANHEKVEEALLKGPANGGI